MENCVVEHLCGVRFRAGMANRNELDIRLIVLWIVIPSEFLVDSSWSALDFSTVVETNSMDDVKFTMQQVES